MAPRCGCGSSGVCNCLITSGNPATLTITGTGSLGNPYVLTAGTIGCYAPAMTRSAALALRGASGLVVGCPVIITDGPTIGAAGVTSTTTILLWPVAANAFGMGAQIHAASFDNSAWPGRYDIDQIGGKIVELADMRGNHVIDDGSTAGMLPGFPWGRANVAYNVVIGGGNNTVLTGWGTAAAAGTQVAGNIVGIGSTVDISGMVGGGGSSFQSNTFVDSTLDVSAAQPAGCAIDNNDLSQGATLTVPAGGKIATSRIAYGASLNTGAFSHLRVVIEGGFTQTLTAANTNTGRNFLGSTLI